jgi:Flp pilus assembly protein TadG
MHQSDRPTFAHALAAKLYPRAKAFWPARQAIAATEFALVLPFLIILMLGSVETARAIVAARSVTLVATTAGEMLSQNGTGKVNYADLHFARRFGDGDLSADVAGRGAKGNFVEK